MKRDSFLLYLLPLIVVLFVLGASVWISNSRAAGEQAGRAAGANGDRPVSRESLMKELAAGNYFDAYEGFRRICLDTEAPTKDVVASLPNAVQCLTQLGRVPEIDDLLEGTATVHQDEWQVLWTVALQYTSVQNHGFLVAGEFERGPHRGGGKYANSVDRDRVLALQLMSRAMPLAVRSDEKPAAARFLLSLADSLLSSRGYDASWRLQYLTDLNELPDYDEGNYGWQPPVGTPVDENGDPVFHRVPENWEAATSDGQRWRWALEQAHEFSPERLNQTRWRLAQFCQQEYGVQTLQQVLHVLYRGDAQDDSDATGTFALHTLAENETIARLATGMKRLELPDEFNHIRIYQQIAAEPRTGRGASALDALAQVFENRRQYPKAAEHWRRAIADFGDSDWRNDRLQQIIGNWGQFESTKPQPKERGATVSFKFRNAKRVRLSARVIKVEELLQDVKKHLRANPRQLDWSQLNVEQLGYRLVTQDQKKYVGREVAGWEESLKPRGNHFDRRISITTPLRSAGAYLLTARVEGGNTSHIVVWVTDTVIVQNALSGGTMYYVTDAVTGSPIERANVEFFGYRYFRDKNRRQQVEISNFAERTNGNGIVVPDSKDLKQNHQYLVIARTADGRLAHLGFRGLWTANYDLPQFAKTKAFCATDRPVYRPGQKLQFKFWIREADYGQDGSRYANRSYSVELRDPQGEVATNFSLQTDVYGGMQGEWTLPGDAKLGQYHFRVLGNQNGHFRVEEYKKPEYEVSVDAPTQPIKLGDKITATIRANYYFGSPVTEATVKYKVIRSKYALNWYPSARWDWCYGPGYWWFGYDCAWYPGWQNWVGCLRPHPIWWPQSYDPPELVLEQEVPIGSDGTVKVEIDTKLARALHGDSDHRYTLTAEVRDQSRRTIVGKGEVLVARQPFKVYAWLDRGYYRRSETIQARFRAQTLDRRPVEGEGKVTLYRVSYNDQRQPIETAVQDWELATNVEGRAELKVKATQEGQYRLSYVVDDGAGHSIEGGYLFTIVGAGFDGSEYRYNALELIPDKREYQPGDQVRLQINSDHANATLLLFIRPVNGAYLPPKVIRLHGKSAMYQIPITKSDMPNFFVETVTVFEGEVHRQAKEIVVPPEKRVLNVDVTPSAQQFKPGEKATVNLHLTDYFGENFVGSTVVAIYDKSVEYISGGSNVPDIKEFFWKWRRHHSPSGSSNLDRYEGNLVPSGKTAMAPIGVFGATVAAEMQEGMVANRARSAMGGMARQAAAMSPSASMESSMVADDAATFGDFAAAGEQSGAAIPLVEPSVRTNFADTALWVGALETDDQGMAEVSLEMPENLTTWKIRVWGMGHGTRVGSGDAEVVTRKNLILRLQAPRFAIQKDQLFLSANVHNYLDEAKETTVVLELPGDEIELLANSRVTVTIPADGEQRIDWPVRIAREGMTTIRMKALTDEESDAMEVQLPCHVHGILQTESWAGTVRPDLDRTTVTIDVPAERRPDQTRLEIRYSPTLAAAMVDALPYLADYPYGCTEQTLNRFLPTVMTQKTLLDMNISLDEIRAKRTNLNAQELGDDQQRAKQWRRYAGNPVFDPDELARMVKDGVNQLTEMQLNDGGWGWFSGWGARSYPHTTAVVVRGLGIAQQNDVALVPGVLDNGVNWLIRYQEDQVRRLQNETDGKSSPKRFADNLDALVYLTLIENGTDNLSMREILDRDRTNLSVYGKALFGLALHHVEDQARLALVMKNLEQYLVQDAENETAHVRMPQSGYWWYWYGDEIETHAMYLKLLSRVEPNGIVAPRLVKYILNNRTHATYWNSTRDTALCVEAFADYLRASGESRPDMVVEVWVDGERRKEVAINSENLFSFDNQFVMTGQELETGPHVVEIRRRGEGPVYFNAYLTNFTLEDPIEEAGLEIKVTRRYYHLVPVDKEIKVAGNRGQAVGQRVEKFQRIPLGNLDEVGSGELVEVDLVIESKNDYEYLLFEDRKAAGFEAVELRSGYTANGLGAFTEYRDDRVSFFVRQLARGRHSISYRLRAETPGQFSALPASASGMYAPELRGNSAELKLRIED
jgi:hypothetical protein